MRDEDKEADQEVQTIQMNKKKNIRKAALKYYYNNYEYCTLHQQLYKNNARQAKRKKLIIMIIMTIKLYVIILHLICLIVLCMFDCVLKTCQHYYYI